MKPVADIIHRASAFTLSELIVCIAIVSVVAVLLLPVIESARSNSLRTLKRAAAMHQLRISVQLSDDDKSLSPEALAALRILAETE